MKARISPTNFAIVRPLRELYRSEMGCQIVHDSAHEREGCSRHYLIEVGGQVAGYAAVWVGPYWMVKGSVYEFYVRPEYRSQVFGLFEDLLREVAPVRIHAQTNDPFLGPLIFDDTRQVVAGHILFSAGTTTDHPAEGAVFRQVRPEERAGIFAHRVEPVGDWALDLRGRIIATGGVLYHYNRPYGDVFMEVDAAFHRQGYGRFLVQELKKVCLASGSVPAARCLPGNVASRQTLASAGFHPCARLVHGDVSVSS